MKRIYACIAVILALCSGVFAAGTATSKGAVRINPKDDAVMVWVPTGEFIMGSTDAQIIAATLKEPSESLKGMLKNWFDSEKPHRKVYLDGYWIYKYEVTVTQYREFCKATKKKMPESPPWGWKENHPIVKVSWQDAVDYAKWSGVSLPTEAQWEKAARGIDGRLYPWGDKWDASKCLNSVKNPSKNTVPVGSYPAGASPYGCMDMAGNANEWCADWYDANYYKNAPSRNPIGPDVPDHLRARVLRGGSWHNYIKYYFRCTDRFGMYPAGRSSASGFRCVMNPVFKKSSSK